PPGGVDRRGGGRATGYRLGQPGEGGAVQAAQERVAGDRALVEADDLGALPGRPAREVVDAGEVVRLVAVTMLELRGPDADVAHSLRTCTPPARAPGRGSLARAAPRGGARTCRRRPRRSCG